MKNKITLFENGKDIQEGDKFVAHVDSVEGHRRVTLVPLIVDDVDCGVDTDVSEEGAQRQEEMRDSYD